MLSFFIPVTSRTSSKEHTSYQYKHIFLISKCSSVANSLKTFPYHLQPKVVIHSFITRIIQSALLKTGINWLLRENL